MLQYIGMRNKVLESSLLTALSIRIPIDCFDGDIFLKKSWLAK